MIENSRMRIVKFIVLFIILLLGLCVLFERTKLKLNSEIIEYSQLSNEYLEKYFSTLKVQIENITLGFEHNIDKIMYDDEKIYDYLEKYNSLLGLPSDVYLGFEDNRFYYRSGSSEEIQKKIDVNEELWYKKVKDRGCFLVVPYGGYERENKMILSMPLYNEKREFIGAIGRSVNLNALEETLQVLKSEVLVGEITITDSNGNEIITLEGNNNKDNFWNKFNPIEVHRYIEEIDCNVKYKVYKNIIISKYTLCVIISYVIIIVMVLMSFKYIYVKSEKKNILFETYMLFIFIVISIAGVYGYKLSSEEISNYVLKLYYTEDYKKSQIKELLFDEITSNVCEQIKNDIDKKNNYFDNIDMYKHELSNVSKGNIYISNACIYNPILNTSIDIINDQNHNEDNKSMFDMLKKAKMNTNTKYICLEDNVVLKKYQIIESIDKSEQIMCTFETTIDVKNNMFSNLCNNKFKKIYTVYKKEDGKNNVLRNNDVECELKVEKISDEYEYMNKNNLNIITFKLNNKVYVGVRSYFGGCANFYIVNEPSYSKIVSNFKFYLLLSVTIFISYLYMDLKQNIYYKEIKKDDEIRLHGNY